MKPNLKIFPLIDEKINWFPGHMFRALKLMNETKQNINVYLELRDARCPISSRNYEFDKIIAEQNKFKIILFNKVDLCNQRVTNQLISRYKEAGIDCLSTSAKNGNHLKDTLKKIQNIVKSKFKTIGVWLQICGMPNTGKSTIINQIRQISPYLEKKTALAKVTKIPCTTKNLQGIKISSNPNAYLVDTPGIMVPRIIDNETALKLSLLGCVKDIIPGNSLIIEYMLWHLNQQKVKKYIHYYGLKQEAKIAEDLILQVREKYFMNDYDSTCEKILIHFREGKLGYITLDNIDFAL